MKYKLPENVRAQEMVEGMSVRQLIGQVICPKLTGAPENFDPEISCVFLPPCEKDAMLKTIGAINSGRALPALILSDPERSPEDITPGTAQFSSMLGLSQSDSEQLAYQAGKEMALDSLDTGVMWALSPTVDIIGREDSPMAGLYSAGHTAAQVIKIAGAYMNGIQSHGVAATLKHFPGDGFSGLDRHLTTPENPLCLEEWHKKSGAVFKEMIEMGAASIMAGHISFPAYDDIDPETGLNPPATLSKKLMVDLLRYELGFEGIIISDAVSMGGMAGYMNYYKACAAFLERGGDCLLFPNALPRFYGQLEELVYCGYLSENTLKDRAYRMLCFKLELLEKRARAAVADTPANRQTAQEAVCKGITLVRDRKGLVPFKIDAETRVLHVVILNAHERHEALAKRMYDEICRYTPLVEQLTAPGADTLFELADSSIYDLIICSVGNMQEWGTNVPRLHGSTARNMMGGWTHLNAPVIFVAHFDPFIHKEYHAIADTIINTYGDIACSAHQLMLCLTGEQPINTRLVAHD